MWREVDPAEDPEGHLLEIATALDISGARADVLPSAFVAEVLAAHPRGALGAEFMSVFKSIIEDPLSLML